MIKKILILVVITLAAFLVVVALQPSQYRIARSVSIAAPSSLVFAQVNSLQKAHAWSPWVKLDPAGTYGFEGPSEGVGAVSTWSGNSDIGAGRQTITESRAGELVRSRLDFIRPFEGTADSEFNLKAEGNRITVTWSMSGRNDFVSKIFCLFMNQDKMIGGQFEKGLAELKVLLEASAGK